MAPACSFFFLFCSVPVIPAALVLINVFEIDLAFIL